MLKSKVKFAQDIVFEKDVFISCIEKDDPVHVFRGVVDSRETEMMQISETVGTEQANISPCPPSLVEFICGQQ